MGQEYVRLTKLELGLTRLRRSKITGKTYRARYTDTGRLANSFKYDINREGFNEVLDIAALDYADDVIYGLPRSSQVGKLAGWIEGKPVRLRGKDGKFIQMTPDRVHNFASFLEGKLERLGSDLPADGVPFMDEIQDKIQRQFGDELSEAIAKDIADDLTTFLNNLPNTTAQNV